MEPNYQTFLKSPFSTSVKSEVDLTIEGEMTTMKSGFEIGNIAPEKTKKNVEEKKNML